MGNRSSGSLNDSELKSVTSALLLSHLARTNARLSMGLATLIDDPKSIFASYIALLADMPLTDFVGCSLFTYDKYEVGYFQH